MFEIGDLIIYSAHGVCRIDDIHESTVFNRSQQYYVLHPVENPALSISVPVNNNKVVMLKVMTPIEADAILTEFQSNGMEWIENKSVRSRAFADILHTGERKEIASLVSTLMRKKDELEHLNKKFAEQDNRTLASAEKILFGDLAIAYNCKISDIRVRVQEILDNNLQNV